VAGFASPANFRERRVVAREWAGLGFVEAGEGCATADSSFGEHVMIKAQILKLP
jgi:hypothetical protein